MLGEAKFMTKIEQPSDPAQRGKELAELRARSLSIENEMSRLLKNIDGNSNYRNDIIWLAEELNQVQKKIKDLESVS
jgi:archaellum component FlaC